jgi:hypothetical protein
VPTQTPENILLVYLGHGQAYPVDQSKAALQGGKLDEEATLKKFHTSPKIPVPKHGMSSEKEGINRRTHDAFLAGLAANSVYFANII